MKIPKITQLPSGKYNCYLRLTGQPPVSITEDTEQACRAKAMAYKAGILKAKRKAEPMTLREACTAYIESRQNRLSPTTIQGYEKIRDHAFQSIMDRPLPKITEAMLDRAMDEECGRTSRSGARLTSKSVKNHWFFIVSVLKKYAPDLNTDTITVPETKRRPVRPLPDPKDVYALVQGTELELPVLLTMWLSFSMSELRGLTKSRSISGDVISVVETVVDVHGQPVRKAWGKEEERSRSLVIPDHIRALIDAVDGDIICPLSAQTMTKRFYALQERAGFPHLSWHQLRHINASTMSMLGIPDRAALDRGGWKTDHVYKGTYVHTFDSSRREADAKINAHFESIIGGQDQPSETPEELAEALALARQILADRRASCT